MNILQMSSKQTDALCSDPSNTFNFVYNSTNYQGYIRTCVALTSIYLYNDKFNTANAHYYNTFAALTGWNSIQITKFLHGPNSMASYFVTSQL